MAESESGAADYESIYPQMSVASLLSMNKRDKPPRRKVSMDSKSTHSETTAQLYRYGQEIHYDNSSWNSQSLSHSISSLGAHSTKLKSMSDSVVNTNSVYSLASEAECFLPTVKDRPLSSKPLKMRLVSGSQFRLTSKAPPKCEHCEQWERLHKKDKERIRGLRLQVTRLEESVKDLKFSKASDLYGASGLNTSSSANNVSSNSNTPSGQSRERYSEDEAALINSEELVSLHRLKAAEEEAGKLKKLLHYERNLSDILKKNVEEQKNAHYNEMQRLQLENSELLKEVDSLKGQNVKAKAEAERMNSVFLSLEKEHDFCQKRLHDALLRLQAVQERQKGRDEDGIDTLKELQRLQQELADAKSRLSSSEQQNAVLKAQNSQQEAQLLISKQAAAAAEEAREMLSRELHSSQETVGVNAEQLTTQKKRIEVMEATLKQTVQERDAEKGEKDRTERKLGKAQEALKEKGEEADRLQQRLNDLMKRMAAESANTKKALEKAITASVRLCVVAPTVNVNVADSKNKFKSKMPDKTLRDFLDSEVFSKYSFLFKQDQENGGPNGEGSMEQWLKKMLSHMQSTIENHVSSAMEGSSI